MNIINKKTTYVTKEYSNQSFTLFNKTGAASIYVAENDYKGVIRISRQLQQDICKLSRFEPAFLHKSDSIEKTIIIGTIGHSAIIDTLIKNNSIDVSTIENQWDTYIICTVHNPVNAIYNCLVIAGSNKRGTIYGMYNLSEKMGVSPWHWWADIPVQKKCELYVIPGIYTPGVPKVKYRGFFINDEYPCLGNMVFEKFGGFNHTFYKHVFDLLLRLYGNYLWPAMWNETFNADDPLNAELADELGVVMGTSHHEPLMRAWKEWTRTGQGEWNLQTNREFIVQFWKEAIERMGDKESIVTIGMRGDGDEPLSEESSIEQLNDILVTQRQILKEVTGKNPEDIPQLWAVYKEVQQYYEKGIDIPSDVTVMLCDDNWGNLRILPRENDRKRQGGYGLYYHCDYVGGPRNYKWVNSSLLPRMWEQLRLATNNSINNLWIVNVGDLKPLEFPLDFFLNFAWDPETWSHNELENFTRLWVKQQFGEQYADNISEIVILYTKYNARRKPELLDPSTYSLINFREADHVLAEYDALVEKTLKIKSIVDNKYLDAFYELIEYPVLASANLNNLHISTAKNHFYARQGRAAANDLAEQVKNLFQRDKELSDHYHSIANGKWNHMASQTHISYSGWQQPEKDVVPYLKRIKLPESTEMGIAIEGSENWWPLCQEKASLPEFSPFGAKSFYIEIFNRGTVPFTYNISNEVDWILISKTCGTISHEKRIEVSIDWQNVPAGENKSVITIQGEMDILVEVNVTARNFNLVNYSTDKAFIESNNIVSMEAAHFVNKFEPESILWSEIPHLSKTHSGMTCLPVIAKEYISTSESPRLEYSVFLLHEGQYEVFMYHSPDNNLGRTSGLCFAIGIDDENPITVNIHAGQTEEDWYNPLTTNEDWNRAVADNIRISKASIVIKNTGFHVLKYYALSTALVLQKIVISYGTLPYSYLGPKESYWGQYPLEL